jgi:hypothetical protein
LLAAYARKPAETVQALPLPTPTFATRGEALKSPSSAVLATLSALVGRGFFMTIDAHWTAGADEFRSLMGNLFNEN